VLRQPNGMPHEFNKALGHHNGTVRHDKKVITTTLDASHFILKCSSRLPQHLVGILKHSVMMVRHIK